MDEAKTSTKATQLPAQLIPGVFKFFPALSRPAIDTHIELIHEEELGVRVQAITGLPLFCKDRPEHIPEIVDILVQLLAAEESVERDAVLKALMALLRQDAKASFTALFKHIALVGDPKTDEFIREKVLSFIRDKVFPIKAELLKPQEEMERHITDLIKKSLEDVTGAEFTMFMDFVKSLGIFGEKAPGERVQELIGIIEGQADLDSPFIVEDADHIDRLISCLFIALPVIVRGASSNKFLNYINKRILPVSDMLPDERRLDLLKALAEVSPFTTPEDSCQILPNVVQLLKKYMPRRNTGEEFNFTYVECLLYTFHNLAHKMPNATNSLCGYKIMAGQPSDKIQEDFHEQYTEFTERLCYIEELTNATMNKLTQGIAEKNKAMAAAESDGVKDTIITEKQKTTTELRTCNNILAMTKPLHSKTPSFFGDKSISTSWKEAINPGVAFNTPATGIIWTRRRPPMTELSDEAKNIEKLYEFCQLPDESKAKPQVFHIKAELLKPEEDMERNITDLKEKDEGKGTTNLAYIYGGSIYFAVDSRGTHLDFRGFINTESAPKYYEIKHNIIGTMTGVGFECLRLLQRVRAQIDQSSIDDDVCEAARHAKQYVVDWEIGNNQNPFPGTLLIAGFGKDKTPHVYTVGSPQVSHDEEQLHGVGDGFCVGIGTGGQDAMDWLGKKLVKAGAPNTKEGVLRLLKASLLIASLEDELTGGWFRMCEVRPYNWSEHLECKEMLEVLNDCYDDVEDFIGDKIFTIWFEEYFSYEMATNEELEQKLADAYFDTCHVIARKRMCVIRMIGWKEKGKIEDVCKSLVYEYIKRFKQKIVPHLEFDIPEEIRRLPWFPWDEKPVLFTRPTREIVNLLRDA